MSTLVKICGVTRSEDAEAAVSSGADIIGMNFYAPSPRCVALGRALEMRAVIGSRARVAGVFVNSPRQFVAAHVSALGLDLSQFHGDEDDDALAGWNIPVIRALRLKPADEPRHQIARSRADFVLLDTFHDLLYGGTGQARTLAGLDGIDLSRVVLSGGLNCENVLEAAALGPYAVDVASGVESAPGIKDHSRLRSFIRNAKSAR